MMKSTFFAMFAAVALLLGMSSCTAEDNPTPADTTEVLEQSLVGLWSDEFEYAGETEAGEPFSRVLLAVQVDADHTGCIYLGAFGDTSDEPLAVYGGPEDAGFKWRLLADGTVILTDLTTGEDVALTRAVVTEASKILSEMANVSNTSMSFNNGSVTVNNDGYNGNLAKADAAKTAEIAKKMTVTESSCDIHFAALGSIVGTDGKAYPVADKDKLPAGVTVAGMVAYKNGLNGLVIALADEPRLMDFSTAKGPNGAAAHTPAVEGRTWRVPELEEWKQMCKSFGGSPSYYGGMEKELVAIGGDSSKFVDDFGYWSGSFSSKFGTLDMCWLLDFYNGTIDFWQDSANGVLHVRACFSF